MISNASEAVLDPRQGVTDVHAAEVKRPAAVSDAQRQHVVREEAQEGDVVARMGLGVQAEMDCGVVGLRAADEQLDERVDLTDVVVGHEAGERVDQQESRPRAFAIDTGQARVDGMDDGAESARFDAFGVPR